MFQLNFEGLMMGLATFLIIGLFHPLVIKGEYYLGARVSKILFIIMGIASAVASALVSGFIPSTLLGIISFSSFWGILEVSEQVKRVERGWFPANPRRARRADSKKSHDD
ncbi:MAG: DUF4491 family protein [Bacteroides sp.]|nr:DUF4491 family protein [Bacteroides sp.]MBD5368622.1 DUF4491 family protein [Bacteroides sp.]